MTFEEYFIILNQLIKVENIQSTSFSENLIMLLKAFIDNNSPSPNFEFKKTCGLSNSPLKEGWSQTGELKKPYRTIAINDNILLQNPITELPYKPNLKEKAKQLRQARNLSEVLFWKQVNKGGFHNIDFDRQRVIGNYIVDFYVKRFGLVIEIDGASHDYKGEYDQEREEFLKQLGLKVYRIKVVDIFKRLTYVMLELENYFIENYGIQFVGNTVILPPRSSTTPPSEGNFVPEQFSEFIPFEIYNYKIDTFNPINYWNELNNKQYLTQFDFLYFQKIIIVITETKKMLNN
jgi:very-short-patch-repair endonuclease